MARALLLLALLALVPAALAAEELRQEVRRYVSTETNAPWYQPHAATCDAPIAAEGVCFRLAGDEASVHVRVDDQAASNVWATAVFTDAPYGGLGLTVWTYEHFCGGATLPVTPGATRLEVYLQPGAYACGASGTSGTVTATFHG